MKRWFAGSLLALGFLVGGLWLLSPRDPAEPHPTTGALAAPAGATSDLSTARAVAPKATSTPVALAAPSPAVTASRDAGPEGSPARTAARVRLSAAWSCLERADLDPADRSEIWLATLTPEHQRQAEEDHAQAIAWAEQNCRDLPPELLDKNGRLLMPELLALASTGPDDPRWRLATALRARKKAQDQATTDDVRAALEALLRSVLAAPATDDLQLIGAVVSTQGPFGTFSSGVASNLPPTVWALAACDLGADCGPRSPVVRQLCLQSLLCGYPTLESAVLDGIWPQGQAVALQEERRRLVQRLRDGGGVGVFDPVTPPPGGG